MKTVPVDVYVGNIEQTVKTQAEVFISALKDALKKKGIKEVPNIIYL